VTEQQDIIATFSEMAPRYESLMNNELNKFWGIDYKDFVSRLLSDINISNSDLILDIATGTAFIPAFLLNNNLKFKKIIGLDLTYGMLWNGKARFANKSYESQPGLVCASAHQMPFRKNTFDQAICCLATHHMHAETLLTNIQFALKPGGKLHIADAGGSSKWKNRAIRLFIKTAAFLYFLFAENYFRALAESAAIGNIHTKQEWEELVKNHGFVDVNILQMKSKRFWTPDPIIIKAIKTP
jgi:ubiquinone/menaquinone biosynthesis C-methylase UbiE